jgi:hypothetical protein
MRLMEKKRRTDIWIFWGIIFVAFSVFAEPVPDTGQTTCYDTDGNVITCPSPGEPFYGQDANYTINPPLYTKLDAKGNALADSATSWTMVRDNVTGLIWEVKTHDHDGSIHDKLNTYTWYDPDPATNGGNAGTPGEGTDTDDFINALNSAGFGSSGDWRMPTRKELISICDYGRDPSIKTEYFPNTMSTSSYWSSTTTAYNLGNAWHVYYGSCSSHNGPKYNYLYVRAVRDGQ